MSDPAQPLADDWQPGKLLDVRCPANLPEGRAREGVLPAKTKIVRVRRYTGEHVKAFPCGTTILEIHPDDARMYWDYEPPMLTCEHRCHTD